jgi:hypothetical protein
MIMHNDNLHLFPILPLAGRWSHMRDSIRGTPPICVMIPGYQVMEQCREPTPADRFNILVTILMIDILYKEIVRCNRDSLTRADIDTWQACSFLNTTPGAATLIKQRFDRRPRGISLQQLEAVQSNGACRSGGSLSLFFFLSGPEGYRADSEDSKRVQGAEIARHSHRACRIRTVSRRLNSRYMFGTEVIPYPYL